MSLEIQLEPNVSIEDLQQAQQEGFSVLRSAHIGNARGYNLALAEAGLPMMLVDHTIVAQTPDDSGDRNYLPGSIVRESGIEPLPVEVGGLALRTEIRKPEMQETQFIDEFHVANLQQAFPDTNIVTNTEYLRNEETISQETIAVAAALTPELFRRLVEADGTMRETDSSFAGLLDTYGTLQLNDDPRRERGVLLPNEVDMLIDFLVEALRSERDTQFHLSGPDMANYTKSAVLQQQLQRLYEGVRQRTSFGKTLPEALTVKLVPAAHARYVTSPDNAEVMEALFSSLQEKSVIQEEKSRFFATDAAKDPDQRQAFLDRMGEQQLAIMQDIGSLALELGGIFAGPREAPFFSQYDVLEKGIATADANKTWTMAELDALTKQITKMRGKVVCTT